MDDKQQTPQQSAEEERTKGADLEYDAQDEDALDETSSSPKTDGEVQK